MREILFRGKRVDNGEWVYGLLCRVGDTYANIVEKDTEVMCTVLTNTIGQFTGLTDKNGKKIFEGDIVVINTSEKRKIKKYRVEFDNGIFGIRLSTNANDNTIIPLRSFDYYKDYKPPTIIEAENSSAIDDDVKKYCDYLKSETYDFCNRIENGEVSE